MGRVIRARVKGGVLEPLETLDLPEGTEVSVNIEETPGAAAADDAFARAAGAWKGKVDTDELIRMLYEARLRPSRTVGP